jgi:hypothetical protein
MKIEDGTLRPFLPEGRRITRRRTSRRPTPRRDGLRVPARHDRRFGNIYGERCLPLVIDASDRSRSTRRDWAARKILAAVGSSGGRWRWR